jgi:hypothetical protein
MVDHRKNKIDSRHSYGLPNIGVPALGETLDFEDDPNHVGIVIDRMYDHTFGGPTGYVDYQREKFIEIDMKYITNPNVTSHRVVEWFIWVHIINKH